MTTMIVLLLPIFAMAAFAAYVRLAPSNPVRWHVALPADGPPDCAVHPATGSATFACTYPDPPESLLARLDAVARATPRTIRLAGDPASGRITYVTRSSLWGFPDYTTAQTTPTAEGTRLDLHARLRFGSSDMGVNAARLGQWSRSLSFP